MKKIQILFFAIGIIALGGCKKYLTEEVQGSLLGSGALSSQQGLEAALTGAYAGIENTWSTGFIHATAIGATMGGDDITTHKASNKADFRQFDQFDVTSTNQRTQALYSGCYKTIQGANNIIANYKTTAGDAAIIKSIAGEAYLLRGFSYYWLVRLYGKIPLMTNPNFADSLLTIHSSQPAVVYALIESDLTTAATLLPTNKRDPGRPNKGTALAYLADVYLTEGGWPIKDPTKYALAAATAKEVINDSKLYGFHLVPTYAELWANNPATNGTSETVFQLSTFLGVGSTTNANYGASAMPGEEGGWDDFFSELNFYRNFPSGPRKDATFDTLFTMGNGSKLPYQQSQTQHPYYKKYYQFNNNSNWNSSTPECLMRYAYILTIYAEAQARATGMPDELAYQCINSIRLRAGEAPLAGLSGPDFAAAVVQEKAWEFAAERYRWFDLVRLEMVEQANANKDPNDLQPIGPITKSDYTFPLPYSETSVNPNL